MSCQVRKWRAAGAAAAAASAECRAAAANSPAKKEMDTRFSELLAARAAQDAAWGPPIAAGASSGEVKPAGQSKYTSAGR